MNPTPLQQSIDQFLAVTRQRWILAALAVVIPIAASSVMAGGSATADTWVVFLVAGLASLAVYSPDSPIGLFLLTVLVIHWVTLDLSVTSGWSLVLAVALLTIHTALALMATTPPTTVLPTIVLRRWIERVGAAVGVTGAVWILVLVLEQREATGSLALSVAAFAALAGGVTWLRSRVLAPNGAESTD